MTYRDDQFDMLRHLIATILDLAIVEALSIQPSDDREIWFMMDEVDSLSKVSSLQYALTKLRKYGGRCVLGLQTISQLRATYGELVAQTLMANVGTKVVLRAGDGETADYFCREFGHQEIQRSQSSISRQDMGVEQTNTLSDVREERLIVLDSDIAGLPDLEGYLKRPASLTKIKLEYHTFEKRTEAFVSGSAAQF